MTDAGGGRDALTIRGLHAARGSRPVRVFTRLDSPLVIRDLYAKARAHQ